MSAAFTRTRYHSSFLQEIKIYKKKLKLILQHFEFKFRINSTLKPHSEHAAWQPDTGVLVFSTNSSNGANSSSGGSNYSSNANVKQANCTRELPGGTL
jgi:hypothetical protein